MMLRPSLPWSDPPWPIKHPEPGTYPRCRRLSRCWFDSPTWPDLSFSFAAPSDFLSRMEPSKQNVVLFNGKPVAELQSLVVEELPDDSQSAWNAFKKVSASFEFRMQREEMESSNGS